jgi:hypothetical protein
MREARLTYTPKKDLTFRMKYEYDYEEDRLEAANKTVKMKRNFGSIMPLISAKPD